MKVRVIDQWPRLVPNTTLPVKTFIDDLVSGFCLVDIVTYYGKSRNVTKEKLIALLRTLE